MPSLDGRASEFSIDIRVGLEFRHVFSTWVTTIVGIVTFAGDYFRFTVSIEVGHGDCMGLGEAVIDEFPIEFDSAFCGFSSLSPPVQTVVMTLSDDHIVLSVFI